MTRFIASLALLACAPSLAACSQDPRKQLEGRWVGEKVEHFSSVQAARADGWAAGTSFEFRGSKVTVSVPAESPREGSYQITRVKEGALELAFLGPDGARDKAEFQREGERLRWQLGDGRSILLRRAHD
ncbi:MAG: hypothetical protein FJ096_04715 [Deltaproteobacteria bacterium]|nr:hypothetical protein [Deltaproteobacteria bacterium]